MYYAIFDDATAQPITLNQLSGHLPGVFFNALPLFTSKKEAKKVIDTAKDNGLPAGYWYIMELGKEPDPSQINENDYWIPGTHERAKLDNHQTEIVTAAIAAGNEAIAAGNEATAAAVAISRNSTKPNNTIRTFNEYLNTYFTINHKERKSPPPYAE